MVMVVRKGRGAGPYLEGDGILGRGRGAWLAGPPHLGPGPWTGPLDPSSFHLLADTQHGWHCRLQALLTAFALDTEVNGSRQDWKKRYVFHR